VAELEKREFRELHGYVLTFAWFFMPFLGILLMRVSRYLHALTMWAANVSALFIIGVGVYRKYPFNESLFAKPAINVAHVLAGFLLSVTVLLTHLGGVKLLLTNGKDENHRNFGWLLSNLLRVVVLVGWVLLGRTDYAAGLGVAMVFLGLLTKPKPKQK
jgi:uncharacterized membrane protein